MRLNTLPPLFSESDITKRSTISSISDSHAVQASIILSDVSRRSIFVPPQYMEILRQISKRNESYMRSRFISVSSVLSAISRFVSNSMEDDKLNINEYVDLCKVPVYENKGIGSVEYVPDYFLNLELSRRYSAK